MAMAIFFSILVIFSRLSNSIGTSISWIAENYDVQTGLTVSGAVLASLTFVLWFFLKKVRRIDKGFEMI